MLRCPWCGHWEHVEVYTSLLHPPISPKQCAIIYKCREPGCKMLFSLKS